MAMRRRPLDAAELPPPDYSEFGLGAPKDSEAAAQWAIAAVKGGFEYARTQLIAEAGNGATTSAARCNAS